MTRTDLSPGTSIAGYRVERVLGKGGMGVVYEATHVLLERVVALKLLAPHLSDDVALRERFRREAQTQAALDHPNVVPVFEAGQSDDGFYIAMRLVRGQTLKELAAAGELDRTRTLAILRQVADALDFAHAAGIVHRDVKPQNILVDGGERAYLADFGLTKATAGASLTDTGQVMGTLHYIAPEQIQGERPGPECDVYALTAIVFECFTGTTPYTRDTDVALMFAHMSEPPPRASERRPELPDALDAVIQRGMAKAPGDRYRSAGELLDDVERALAGAPVDAVTAMSTRPAKTALLPRARRWPLAALGAAVLCGAAVAGLLIGHSGESRSTASAGPNSVSVPPLKLHYPAGFTDNAAVPTVPGLRLAGAGAVAPTAGPGGETVAFGLSDGAGPTLLPAPFVSRLPRAPRPTDTIALGALQAIRYRNLHPRGMTGTATLYVTPTTSGTATIACVSRRPSTGFGSTCERIAASLELTRAKGLPLGPGKDYPTVLDDVVRRLRDARSAGLIRLAGASTPGAQIRAATRVAGAYTRAAETLDASHPGATTRLANAALVARLRHAASSYARMARAASKGDAAAWEAARQAAGTDYVAVTRALRALERGF